MHAMRTISSTNEPAVWIVQCTRLMWKKNLIQKLSPRMLVGIQIAYEKKFPFGGSSDGPINEYNDYLSVRHNFHTFYPPVFPKFHFLVVPL